MEMITEGDGGREGVVVSVLLCLASRAEDTSSSSSSSSSFHCVGATTPAF